MRYRDPRLGCVFPNAVAWSPDGRTLAYGCNDRSRIFTIRRDGTGRRRIETGLPVSAWPTWSPDGKGIAFEGSTHRGGPSSIYVIGLDGSHRVLVARHASLPDWSPDGKTIAYRSPDGIKLVTPAGVDVTPHRIRGPHARTAPKGAAAWSPDGTKLAVGKLVTSAGGTGAYGPIRPAWYAKANATLPNRRRRSTATCGECL
jgi:dipeptidyl aminopeptidase/acylaminoacyl peptidase